MFILRLLVICCAAALLLAAKDKAPDDAKSIQGDWRVTHLEEEGEKAPPDKVKEFVYSFDSDKLRLKYAGKVVAEGTFKLNPSADPKQIDMVLKDETGRGIYKMVKGRLTICATAFKGNRTRPNRFQTKSGSKTMLIEMERVKP